MNRKIQQSPSQQMPIPQPGMQPGQVPQAPGQTPSQGMSGMPPGGLQPGQMQQLQQMMAQGNGLRKQAAGGKIQPLSSQDAKVVGPSHAEGGVKLPQHGVELEGGETANKGFVFSKKLGYAQKHEQVARQMGKVEKRPDTPINRATRAALQRKTEMLKTHQEVSKAAMGMPNDLQQQAQGMPQMAEGGVPPGGAVGNIIGKGVGSVSDLPMAGRDPDLAFLSKHADEWGAPYGVRNTPGGKEIGLIAPSDKLLGRSNSFYPARNQQRGADVPTQHRSFKFGGKLRKMDYAGVIDPPSRLPNPTANPVMPYIKELDVPDNQAGPEPKMPYPVMLGTVATNPASSDEPSGFSKVAGKLSPFLSNFYNATQRLPLPPNPVLTPNVTPNLVNYDQARAEAVRQTRGANKAARENLRQWGSSISECGYQPCSSRNVQPDRLTRKKPTRMHRYAANSAAAMNAQINAANA